MVAGAGNSGRFFTRVKAAAYGRTWLRTAAMCVLASVMILGAAPPVRGELQQTVRLDLYNVLSSGESGGEWTYSGAGRARIDLRSTGNRMVQGRLVLDAGVTDLPLTFFDISRASVRFRFPVGEDYMFRVTAGKDRLSWGDGVLFNAGDVLFGSSADRADFFGDTLRDETAWMLSGYFPLGQFSFFEAVVLPPQVSPSGDEELSDFTAPLSGGPVSETAAGFRFQFKPANIKVEPGYLFRGKMNTHNPYISMQGHLLADWYLSASTSLAGNSGDVEALGDSAWDGFTLSFGLLHIVRPARDSNLSFRLEGLVRPGGVWEPEFHTLDPENSAPPPRYGILLFPEVVFAPSGTVTAYLRSVVSPVDGSALIIPGVSWNVFQGFSILSFLSVQAGDDDDLYAFRRAGGFSLTAGFSYIY